METFTYKYYEEMLRTLKSGDYRFCFFDDSEIKDNQNIILLRHDIDFDPEKAVDIAKIEKKNNVKSTYFFMLNSGFYNIHNSKVYNVIKDLISDGNRIGIHFDESGNDGKEDNDISSFFDKEIHFFEKLFGINVNIISFHRPTENILSNKLKIPIAHTYENQFSKELKYFSDSAKIMMEGDFIDIIKSGKFKKIQLLIHPIWWNNEKTDSTEDYNCFIAKKTLQLKKEIANNSRIYTLS